MECQVRSRDKFEGGIKSRFEAHPGVRTDHCNVWSGDFSDVRRSARLPDHLLNDRVVDSAFNVRDHEYLVAQRLKFPSRSDSSKVDIMIS